MLHDKVLVFCPTYRLEKETEFAIFNIGFDCFRDYFFTADNPMKGGRQNILYNYRRGRALFLGGDYSHLLIVESDIIPPPDVWLKLRAVNKPVVLGLYCFRPMHSGTDAVNASLYIGTEMGQSYSYHPSELARAKDRVERVSGLGLGCALVERRVMEEINFRDDGKTHTDWTFMIDVRVKGFEIWCDFTARCGHKDEDNQIYWPFEETPDWFGEIREFVPAEPVDNTGRGLVRVRGLKSFAWAFGGMEPFEVRQMEEFMARRYAEAGFVEIIKEEER